MVNVLSRNKLAEGLNLLLLQTPEMSKKTRPGQYVLIKRTEASQSIPLFIGEKDKKGIGVILDLNSPEGKLLGDLKKGSELYCVTGPLGKPLRVGDIGNICIIADAKGIGSAILISNAFRNFENKIYFIASFASKKQRFWEQRIKKSADKFLVVTNKQDALVNSTTSELHGLLRRKHMNLVVAVTDLPLLYKIAKATELRSRTLTMLLPPIGDDGIGMSSHCRFPYQNESRLSCIEGPPVDGHKVDWEALLARRAW
ncbi:MAG: hypothetical protein AABX52_04220 [Nanoarchaeota archaeon]